jgi:NAD(P)-dependent dehydrogenase (short-subunit alcohol dehydrogenase family)
MCSQVPIKVAIITGAGSWANLTLLHILGAHRLFRGIGLESSLLFASEGASVILADINLVAVQKAVSLIEARYPNAHALALEADVGKENDVKGIVDRAVTEFGRLDVMVSFSSLQ